MVEIKKELTNKRLTRIKEMLAENPYLTLQELGDEFGISKQRIGQILRRNGIQKARGNDILRYTHCSEGHEFPTIRRKRHIIQRCFICKPLPHTKHLGEDGLVQPYQVSRPCNCCGKTITRSAAWAETKKNDPRYTTNSWYCNSKCFCEYQKREEWWMASPKIQGHIMKATVKHLGNIDI